MAGDRFGQYELVSRIGRGGMGETWKARRLEVANAPFVVIKRILPQYADDPMFVESFVNEAHVTASLTHRNIAHVLDFGQVAGEYFFVIEYVHGRTLEGLMLAAAQKGFATLPLPVACFVALELLEGLQYAHTRADSEGVSLRLVHRDISPDNVLVGFDGQVKVVDFGVAQARMRGREETEAGIVKGKWPYFSPEQARGEPLDGRSDLFAVGVTLYRMVCGRLPFEGTQLMAVHKMLKADYPSPRLIDPSLPTVLVDCIERALEIRRDQRFQAAENMQTALRTALDATAPHFGEADLRAFVHWCFEGELPTEGVTLELPQSHRSTFEKWRESSTSLHLGAPAAQPLKTSMRETQHTLGPGFGAAKPRNWLAWIGASSFALGVALVVLLVAGNRPPPAPPKPVPPARMEAFLQLTQAVERARKQAPAAVPALDGRFESARRLLGDSSETDEAYLERCRTLEADLTAAVRKATTPRDAPLPEPPAAPLLVLPIDHLDFREEGLSVTLSFVRHNLANFPLEKSAALPFAEGHPANVVLRAAERDAGQVSPLAVLVRSARGKTWSVHTTDRETRLAAVSALRAFRFLPFGKAPERSATIVLAADGGSFDVPAESFGMSHGGYVQVTNLLPFENLIVKKVGSTVSSPFEVVVSCDTEMRLLAQETRFDFPMLCALALVGAPIETGTVTLSLTTQLRPLLLPELPSFLDLKNWDVKVGSGTSSNYLKDIKESERLRKVLHQALRLLARGDYVAAHEPLMRCKEFSPDCWLLLGFTYTKLGLKYRRAALTSYDWYLSKKTGDTEKNNAVRRVLDDAKARRR